MKSCTIYDKISDIFIMSPYSFNVMCFFLFSLFSCSMLSFSCSFMQNYSNFFYQSISLNIVMPGPKIYKNIIQFTFHLSPEPRTTL